MSTQQVEFAKGLEGVIAAKSSLSFIDGQKGFLVYRGIPIQVLAEKSTFEETVYFLWHDKLPTWAELEAFKKQLKAERELPKEITEVIKSFYPKNAHPMDVLKAAVSHLGMYDPDAMDNSREANLRKSTKLVAKFPTIVAYFHRVREGKDLVPPDPELDHAANFLYMLFGEKPDDFRARVMDVALILHAEHGMNASTFTTMVIASTLSDIYSAVVGGVGALKGPLHGGANERVIRMLQEIGDESKVEEWVMKALAEKRKIMGFGHRVYKSYDPRAAILKEYALKLSEMVGDMKFIRMGMKIEEIMIRELGQKKGIYPNVDFYSGIVYYHLGIPIDLFTPIFAISRVAGWTAHVMEYLEDNRIFRPRQLYVGPMEREYIPIEQRG